MAPVWRGIVRPGTFVSRSSPTRIAPNSSCAAALLRYSGCGGPTRLPAAMFGEQRHFQDRIRQLDLDALSPERRTFLSRRALVGHYRETHHREIHRTEANLAYTDPSVHPSARDYGSLRSPRPDPFNYLEAGFAKYQTPCAWPSTRSGQSSRAVVPDNVTRIGLPTLAVSHTGDHAIYPQGSEAVSQHSPAGDTHLSAWRCRSLRFPACATAGPRWARCEDESDCRPATGTLPRTLGSDGCEPRRPIALSLTLFRHPAYSSSAEKYSVGGNHGRSRE